MSAGLQDLFFLFPLQGLPFFPPDRILFCPRTPTIFFCTGSPKSLQILGPPCCPPLLLLSLIQDPVFLFSALGVEDFLVFPCFCPPLDTPPFPHQQSCWPVRPPFSSRKRLLPPPTLSSPLPVFFTDQKFQTPLLFHFLLFASIHSPSRFIVSGTPPETLPHALSPLGPLWPAL